MSGAAFGPGLNLRELRLLKATIFHDLWRNKCKEFPILPDVLKPQFFFFAQGRRNFYHLLPCYGAILPALILIWNSETLANLKRWKNCSMLQSHDLKHSSSYYSSFLQPAKLAKEQQKEHPAMLITLRSYVRHIRLKCVQAGSKITLTPSGHQIHLKTEILYELIRYNRRIFTRTVST